MLSTPRFFPIVRWVATLSIFKSLFRFSPLFQFADSFLRMSFIDSLPHLSQASVSCYHLFLNSFQFEELAAQKKRGGYVKNVYLIAQNKAICYLFIISITEQISA